MYLMRYIYLMILDTRIISISCLANKLIEALADQTGSRRFQQSGNPHRHFSEGFSDRQISMHHGADIVLAS